MPDDLKSAVTSLGMSDPMAQISTGMSKLGGMLQSGEDWVEKKATAAKKLVKSAVSSRSVTKGR